MTYCGLKETWLPFSTRAILALSAVLCVNLGAASSNSVTLTDQTGSTQNARPTTVSRVFKQGEIGGYPRPSVAGTALVAWQSNVMNRWADGSVKHALISFTQTVGASSSIPVLFVNDPNPCHLGNQAACDASAPTQAQILAFNSGSWGAGISATVNSVSQSVSARTMIAAGAWHFWIKGPLCNQIVVEDRSPTLSFDFGFKNKYFATGDYHTPYVQPTDTTIPVIDSSDIASLTFPTTIIWDSEQISICSVTGNTLNVCASGRGFGGTTAAGHATFRSDVSLIKIPSYSNPTWRAASSTTYKSLHPIFVVTLYTGWPGVKEEFILENTWVTKLQAQIYDLSLTSGSQLTTTQFTSSAYSHAPGSRWRQVFWDGKAPGGLNIDYNLSYMEDSMALQNMDRTLVIPSSTLSAAVSAFNATDHGALGGYAQWQQYFPQVGGRPDIGQIPTWTAQYLFTFDPRMYGVVLGNAAAGAYVPIHYRESDTSSVRWFDSSHTVNAAGHPVSIDGRKISFADYGRSGGSYQYSENPTFLGSNTTNGWSPDLAHQADFAYIPYLITGEWFWLEEMYFWTSYDLGYPAAVTYDYYGRHDDWGFIPPTDETRGQAWAWRNIANQWFMTPDGDPEKAHTLEKMNNNVAIREGQYHITNGAFPPSDQTCAGFNPTTSTDKWCWGFEQVGFGSTNNPLHFMNPLGVNQDPVDMDATKECQQDSPWMDNLQHMTFGYSEDLGFTNIHAIRAYLAQNLLGQILDSGYAINGAGWLADAYRMGTVQNPSGSASGCPASQSANTYFLDWTSSKNSQLSSILSTYGPSQWSSSASAPEFGYANIVRAAGSYMTTFTGTYNGSTAWNWILANTNNTAALATNPRWALLPRASSVTSRCDLNHDGQLTSADVDIAVQQVLHPSTCGTADFNHDSVCNVIDVQLLTNAVAAKSCPF